MKDFENLYQTNEYLLQNPSLHVEDSPWKIIKIKYLLGEFVKNYREFCGLQKLNILDVGEVSD